MTMQPHLPDFDAALWLVAAIFSTLMLVRVANLTAHTNAQVEREAAFLEREGRA